MEKLIIFNMGEDTFAITDTFGNSLVTYSIKRDSDTNSIGLRTGVVNNGMLYAIGSYNSRLYKIDYSTGNVLSDTGCVGQYPIKVRLFGDYIYVCCADSDTVHMFAKSNFMHIASVHTGVCITDMDITEDSLIICTMSSRQVYVLSLDGLYKKADFNIAFSPAAVLYDNTTGIIYICGTEIDNHSKGVLCLMDIKGNVLAQEQTGDVPVSMCLYKNNVIVSCSGNDCLALHDKSNGKTLNWIKVQTLPGGLCCIEKEDIVFVCSQVENNISVVNLRLKRCLFTFKAGKEPTDILRII